MDDVIRGAPSEMQVPCERSATGAQGERPDLFVASITNTALSVKRGDYKPCQSGKQAKTEKKGDMGK
jgi:hypothetical protein